MYSQIYEHVQYGYAVVQDKEGVVRVASMQGDDAAWLAAAETERAEGMADQAAVAEMIDNTSDDLCEKSLEDLVRDINAAIPEGESLTINPTEATFRIDGDQKIAADISAAMCERFQETVENSKIVVTAKALKTKKGGAK